MPFTNTPNCVICIYTKTPGVRSCTYVHTPPTTLYSFNERCTVELIEPVALLNVALLITLTDPLSLPLISNACTIVVDSLNAVSSAEPVSVAVAPVVVVQCILASVLSCLFPDGTMSFKIMPTLVLSCAPVPNPVTSRVKGITS